MNKSRESREIGELCYQTEVAYITLICIGELYCCVQACIDVLFVDKNGVDDQSIVEFRKLVEEFITSYKDVIQKYDHAADFVGNLTLLSDNVKSLLPLDYPKETLITLDKIAFDGPIYDDVSFKYSVSKQRFEPETLLIIGGQIAATLKKHISLVGSLPEYFQKGKLSFRERFIQSFKRDETLRQINSVNDYLRYLKSSTQLAVLCSVRFDKHYDVAMQFLNTKIMYYYFQGLLNAHRYFTRGDFKISEEIRVFFHNIAKENASIRAFDEWELGDGHIHSLFNDFGISIKPPLNEQEVIEWIKHQNGTLTILSKNSKEKKHCIYRICTTPGFMDSVIVSALSGQFRMIHDLITKNVLELYDLYRNYDLGQSDYFANPDEFFTNLTLMGYSLVPTGQGDRLDLELCQTIEVIETTDISKDYMIAHVYQDGIKYRDKVIRKCLVSVYRLAQLGG